MSAEEQIHYVRSLPVDTRIVLWCGAGALVLLFGAIGGLYAIYDYAFPSTRFRYRRNFRNHGSSPSKPYRRIAPAAAGQSQRPRPGAGPTSHTLIQIPIEPAMKLLRKREGTPMRRSSRRRRTDLPRRRARKMRSRPPAADAGNPPPGKQPRNQCAASSLIRNRCGAAGTEHAGVCEFHPRTAREDCSVAAAACGAAATPYLQGRKRASRDDRECHRRRSGGRGLRRLHLPHTARRSSNSSPMVWLKPASSGHRLRLVVIGSIRATASIRAGDAGTPIAAGSPWSAPRFSSVGRANRCRDQVVGRHYAYDPDDDQYAPPAAAYVADSAGRVRGVRRRSARRRRPAARHFDAGHGDVGTFADRLHLLCYDFDPAEASTPSVSPRSILPPARRSRP